MSTLRLSTRSASGFAAVLFVLCCSACPDTNAAAPQTCLHAFDKCTLPTGVLGVCDQVECAANEKPPCLVCRSQH